ncbi:nuclear transport factor 2 family protein [Pseudaestuariivita sp.]|uniref:nuclear transport factor 2 family protein n=1 Tax=Pseudaestuariivita sp. TaxID=2211669 RepID=UPI0040598D8D
MTRTADAQAITAVIQDYIQGTKDRDIAKLKEVFHPNAVMAGYLGPNLLAGSPDPFYAHLEANPHAPDPYAGEIVGISVTGRIATAELHEDNLYGMAFVNHFHLLNEDGTWRITAKLFHHD